MTIAQHIDELKAELRGSLDPCERTQIAAELHAATAALNAQNRATRSETEIS